MTRAHASLESHTSAALRAWPGWLRDLAAMLLLALFALAIYRLLLFTNRVLAEGDILLYFYPYRDFAAQALRSGRIPLWNPYLFLGAPFLANPQAAVLYPLHWPLAWLSVTNQVYWSAALHAWIAGAGAYFLMRRLAVGRLGALTAGIVLCGSGFFVGMLGHINQMNGGAWLPWALLLVTPPKTTSRSTWRALRNGCLLALIVALMLLAGHTQTTFVNLVGVGIWVLALAAHEFWHARSQSLPARTRWFHAFQPLLVLAGATILGVLLCAPQLLPTLELSRLGLRSGGLTFQEATSFSLQPLHLPWTLLPTYGLVNLEAAFATPAYTEFAAWIGISGLLLAAIGAWRGRGLPRLFG